MKLRVLFGLVLALLALPSSGFGAQATVASGTVDLSVGTLSVSVAPGVSFEFYGASVFFSDANGVRASTSETVYMYVVLSTGAKYKTELYRGVLSSEYSVTFIPDGPMQLPSTATVYVTSTNGGGTNHATGIIYYRAL